MGVPAWAGQPSRPDAPAADPAPSGPESAQRVAPDSRTAGLRGHGRELLAHLGRPGARAIALVSLPGCGFCALVRERQLGPLRADPAYDDLPVFEISLADRSPLAGMPSDWRSLDGRAIAPADTEAGLARALGAKMAPTVLFLGPGGEVAPSLVGYSSDDFYWAYLSERIAQARAATARSTR